MVTYIFNKYIYNVFIRAFHQVKLTKMKMREKNYRKRKFPNKFQNAFYNFQKVLYNPTKREPAPNPNPGPCSNIPPISH